MNSGLPAGADVVERLGELDLVRVAVLQRVGEDADPGQAVAAEVDDRVGGERVDLQQPGVLPVGDERCPDTGVVERRGGELEVLRVLVVQDEEVVARVLDAVLHTGDARAHDLELARRVVGVEDADLAGDLAARAEDEVLLAAGQADADPEPLVALLVDEHVVVGAVAEGVPVDLVGTPGVVDPGVEERGAVGRPGAAVEDAADLVGELLSRLQVLEGQREALVALVVGGVGQELAVGRDGAGADREEVAVAGQLVAVQEHLLARERAVGGDHRRRVPLGGDPAGDAVLLALLGAREVPPGALAAGDGQVGLLRTALDLLEDLLLELLQVSGLLFEEVVLLLEIGDRVRVFLVGEPRVFVDHGVAVMGALARYLLRQRRDVAAHLAESTFSVPSARERC
ncbi:hypothetical protein GCM10020219_009120 [Nonomuraea dietziae]